MDSEQKGASEPKGRGATHTLAANCCPYMEGRSGHGERPNKARRRLGDDYRLGQASLPLWSVREGDDSR